MLSFVFFELNIFELLSNSVLNYLSQKIRHFKITVFKIFVNLEYTYQFICVLYLIVLPKLLTTMSFYIVVPSISTSEIHQHLLNNFSWTTFNVSMFSCILFLLFSYFLFISAMLKISFPNQVMTIYCTVAATLNCLNFMASLPSSFHSVCSSILLVQMTLVWSCNCCCYWEIFPFLLLTWVRGS